MHDAVHCSEKDAQLVESVPATQQCHCEKPHPHGQPAGENAPRATVALKKPPDDAHADAEAVRPAPVAVLRRCSPLMAHQQIRLVPRLYTCAHEPPEQVEIITC